MSSHGILDGEVRYSTNVKALKRWAAERLSLRDESDGTIEARFRYDGSTCSNMGRAFQFQYVVRLAPRAERHRILDERCEPAPNDEGHRFMCAFRLAPPALMDAIAGEKPLLGHTLDSVLSWDRALPAPGCYCEPASRDHKWGLVLETIHYALSLRDSAPSESNTLADTHT